MISAAWHSGSMGCRGINQKAQRTLFRAGTGDAGQRRGVSADSRALSGGRREPSSFGRRCVVWLPAAVRPPPAGSGPVTKRRTLWRGKPQSSLACGRFLLCTRDPQHVRGRDPLLPQTQPAPASSQPWNSCACTRLHTSPTSTSRAHAMHALTGTCACTHASHALIRSCPSLHTACQLTRSAGGCVSTGQWQGLKALL